MVFEDFLPIRPTFLNRGYQYFHSENWPDIITLIDLGQIVIIFLMVWVTSLSIHKLKTKYPNWIVFSRIISKVISLILISFIFVVII
ncbi:hypothetical protein [Candidatus Harpocratesius sp.]